MPIEKNNLDRYDLPDSIWNRFESLRPTEIVRERKRRYFTAPYNSSIRYKYFLNHLNLY